MRQRGLDWNSRWWGWSVSLGFRMSLSVEWNVTPLAAHRERFPSGVASAPRFFKGGLTPNGTHFARKVAGTFHVPSAICRLRHMECAYYFPK